MCLPLRLYLLSALIVLAGPGAITVRADTTVQIAQSLSSRNLYISPPLIGSTHVRAGDAAMLRQVIAAASAEGVAVKIGLISHFPKNYASASDAAANLQNYVGLSGVLVLVSPRGLGVGSDYFSAAQAHRVVEETHSLCATSYAACAIAAVQRSLVLAGATQRDTHHSVIVFWVVTTGAFLVALCLLAAFTWRRRKLAGEESSAPAA